jgi:hypothetical protein
MKLSLRQRQKIARVQKKLARVEKAPSLWRKIVSFFL